MGDDVAGHFGVDAVLSAYSGTLVCKDFGEVHRLIEHLAGESCFTHQLPTIFRSGTMQRDLLAQFPALADHPIPETDGMGRDEKLHALLAWVATVEDAIGKTVLVARGEESSRAHVPFSAGLERFLTPEAAS